MQTTLSSLFPARIWEVSVYLRKDVYIQILWTVKQLAVCARIVRIVKKPVCLDKQSVQ